MKTVQTGRWTEEETEKLRKLHHDKLPDRIIAEKLNRSIQSIQNRRSRLGLIRPRNYTTEEDALLYDLYHTPVSTIEIAQRLGRSRNSVTCRAKRLGLRRISHYFTSDHLAEIIELRRQSLTLREIAKIIGKSASRIQRVLSKAGYANTFVPKKFKKADDTEKESIRVLERLGFTQARRTHLTVTSNTPEDVEGVRDGIKFGIDVIGSKTALLKEGQLLRILDKYDRCGVLWKTANKRWILLEVTAILDNDNKSECPEVLRVSQ